MSVLTKVGSFTKINTVASQSITGLGFVPKAIIFWLAGSASASGTWASSIRGTLGFTAGPSNSYACSMASADGAATSSAARRMAAKCITITDPAGANTDEAALASFDSDGFTLNWTANGNSGPTSGVICYLAIGGTDITGAKVVAWTTPGSNGNKAVTGAGFVPDLVLHASDHSGSAVPSSATESRFSFGAMNKHGQQWANSISSKTAVNPSNTSRWQQTDAALTTVTETDLEVIQSHFVSMDTDGFTTYFSARTTPTHNVISLCLKGVSSKIGAFAKTTATAPAAQSITRVGFTPKAVLATSVSSAAAGSPQTNAAFAIGAASSVTDQRVSQLLDSDAVNPTVAKSVFQSGYFCADSYAPAGVVTTYARGALTSFDADGFSASFDINGSNADEILYLAIGDAGVNTYPTTVGT